MIEIEKIRVVGWEDAIRGARNPLNSWHLSDSIFEDVDDDGGVLIGPKDLSLLWRLANAGSNDHAKYRRMIIVYADITAPLYWWKEFDTYKVGTVANSCSTMHTIHKEKFTKDMFSFEEIDDDDNESQLAIYATLVALNYARDDYLSLPDSDEKAKKRAWYTMIQLLPSSFNQKRTVCLNYEVMRNINHSRANHKQFEWREFVQTMNLYLPYSFLYTLEEDEYKAALEYAEECVKEC